MMSSPEEKAGAPRAAEHATPDRAGEPEGGDQEALIRALRQEIEQRKQVERELRSENERLHSYVEISPFGVIIASPSGRWLDINDTLCRMLGYSREEIFQKSWKDITHPEDLGKNVDLYERLVAGEINEYEVNKRYIRKDGGWIEVLITAKAVRRPDRSLDYIAAFAVDMTSRLEMERRLRASEQKLQAHFRTTPLAVIEWTNDLRVGAWNPAATRIFGYTEEEALGMPLTDLLPEHARPAVEDVAQAIFSGTGGYYSMNDNLTKDGRVITCEWFNAPLFDESGKCVVIPTIAQDVTSRVRAEAELRAHVATIERQREAIWALSAPLLQVWDGVLALPLIGTLDSARAAMLMERLLARIVETRSHHAIVDLTGVDVVDSAVAKHLQDLLQAMKLLGTRAVVAGIHPAVARTMVSVGLSLSGVAIRSTMQEALKLCIEEGSAKVGSA